MKNFLILWKTISLLLVVFCFTGLAVTAQVKVGNNATFVNPNAVFELESTNKGFLLPRLALSSTTSPAPLNSFTAGILVYDTATVNDITPGLYYCDGTKWIKVNSGGNSGSGPATDSAWNLTGNSGTLPGTNFVGTLDNNDLVFKTNGVERLRLTKTGWVGIGTNNPQAALQIKGQVIIDSLQSGNIGTDSILVAGADGRIKKINASQLSGTSIKKTSITVAATGQLEFTTPALITDADKIMLYRNGVLINFTVGNSNTIVAEVTCRMGDEIKIIQFL
jgi:hypothetical protein